MFILNLLSKLANSEVKVASRSQLYADPKGRSMVEMLGVLAIVGVLSVGAIAGYSKAMMKYKLNKHAESFSSFLNEAIKIYPDMRRHYGTALGYKNISSLMDKLHNIPDGMTYNKHDNLIYDVFKNSYEIVYGVGTRSNGKTYIDYYITSTLHRSSNKLTDRDREICRNAVIAAKENADNLYWIEVRSVTSSENYTYTNAALYGDRYHNSNKNLRTASITQIDEICNSCDSERSCSIIIYINIEN